MSKTSLSRVATQEYSLTFRPPFEKFEKIKPFCNKFTKTLKLDQYLIAEESGENSDTPNHYQIYIKLTKPTRSDNLKTKLVNAWNITDQNEKIHTWEIKPIKPGEENTVIGYCLKEEKNFIISGIDETKLNDYKNHYNKVKKINKIKKGNTILNFNEIGELFKSLVIELNDWSFDMIYKEFKKNICFRTTVTTFLKLRREGFEELYDAIKDYQKDNQWNEIGEMTS